MTLIAFVFFFIFGQTLYTAAGDLPNQLVRADKVTNENIIVIRNVEIQGNYKTKEKIILRELAVHSGDTLQKGKIEALLELERQKVFNLNLFTTVKISLKNQTGNEADLVIEVKERWYYVVLPTFYLADRNFSDWWYNHNHDFSRTIYGIYASNNNLTGRNDKLRITAETGFIPSFDISYLTPYLDKAQHTNLAIGTSYALSRTMAYKDSGDQAVFLNSENKQREFWTAYLLLSRRQGFYKFHSFQLGYTHTTIGDTIAKLNPDYLLNGRTQQKYFLASYSYQFDNRDSKQYALKGERFVVQATKYGLFGSDDINQLAITSSYTQYYPLGGRFYANFSVRGKVSFPQKQPYLQAVGLGYRADYVRGYELYVVDGQSYGLLKTNLKFKFFDKVFDLHKFLKIRQFNTLPIAAYVNSFVDFGYANNSYPELSNSRLANSLLIGGGVGVDLVSWYNYVGRFNYAVNRMGEGRIYFSAGREF